MVKPYRLLARLHNNRLWAAIRSEFPGVRTQTEAAQLLGVPVQSLNGLMTMRVWPWNARDGRWWSIADTLAQRLRETPEYLFDAELYGRAPVTLAFELEPRQLAEAGLLALPPAPDAGCELDELRAAVARELETLTPREADILRRRFALEPYDQEQTCEEIGSAFAVGRSRVAQIEAKALRKLRHPAHVRLLRDVYPMKASEAC